MENISSHQNGLTNDALFQFLAEVSPEDTALEAEANEANQKIMLEEETSNFIEFLGSPEMIELRRQGQKERARRLKEEKLRIQREAFNQDIIRLSDTIDKAYIKLLISDLVAAHSSMVDKYGAYINKRLASLLSSFIPRGLKKCFALYPKSFKACPGFTYQASKEYGDELLFWATPNIPYYIPQGTEQSLLRKHKPDSLFNIDKAVYFYHLHAQKKQEKELKYATVIVQKKVQTYYDLLKLNPFWFEALYKRLQEK